MSDDRNPTAPFAVALELDALGAHPGANSAPAAYADALHARRLARAVQTAERLGFTAVTFDDAPVPPADRAIPRLDAIQRAAFVAPLTSAIGLVPVAHVAYSEPFHVATQLASLDWASAGRAGWIPVATSTEREAAAFGGGLLDAAALRRERDDAIEVARRLWDSWEDDAVIRDVATGRYLDRGRLHYVDFVGEAYSVKGPLITPRPPQGQLVVVAEATTTGADVALVAGADAAAIGRAADDARDAGARLVWAEVEVALDARGVTAADRVRELDRAAAWDRGEALRHVGDGGGFAALVAALAAHVDGIRVRPAEIDVDVEELGRVVLPALRRSVGFRSPTAGTTLRHSLGLARPENRYTAVKEIA